MIRSLPLLHVWCVHILVMHVCYTRSAQRLTRLPCSITQLHDRHHFSIGETHVVMPRAVHLVFSILTVLCTTHSSIGHKMLKVERSPYNPPAIETNENKMASAICGASRRQRVSQFSLIVHRASFYRAWFLRRSSASMWFCTVMLDILVDLILSYGPEKLISDAKSMPSPKMLHA